MLIDRGDRIINICEMKFSNDEYSMDAEESLFAYSPVAACMFQGNVVKYLCLLSKDW